MTDYRSKDFKVGYHDCYVQAWDENDRDSADITMARVLPAKETVDPETGEVMFQGPIGTYWTEADIAGWRRLANEILEACDALDGGSQ